MAKKAPVPPKNRTPAKPPAKTPAKTKKSAGDIAVESLAKELRSLIPKLDAEGLAFLVKQARVHIYNMQVDELNKAAQAAYSASTVSKAVKAQKVREQKASKSEKFDIKATDSGSGYYLYYNNDNAVFNREEMTCLVKIVYGEGSEQEICERIFRWLERERMDVFQLIPIADKFDPRLNTLVSFIKKNFKLRK